MSPPKNKFKKPNEVEESSSSDSDSSEDDNGEKYDGNEVIQIEFEGRNPIQSDFHGIRQLLKQLFLKSEINLSEMADIITDQNFIGSVVIQSFGDDAEDDEDSDDGDANFESTGTIFGITTALNISKSFASGCTEDLRKYIRNKCQQFAPAESKANFEAALDSDEQRLGFLINERFVNIPPQISVPLLENLHKEITRAATKKDKFSFTHYAMLVKFYRKDAKKSKNKANDDDGDIYSNGEEEILCEKCDVSFEYNVRGETDSGLSGNWTESDRTLTPYRRLILFEAAKLPSIIESIKQAINEENQS